MTTTLRDLQTNRAKLVDELETRLNLAQEMGVSFFANTPMFSENGSLFSLVRFGNTMYELRVKADGKMFQYQGDQKIEVV